MSTFIVSLLNMSITASIIIVAVICIRFLLKKAPKAFSYALWGLVLLRLLCPITISSQFSVFNLLHVNTNTTGELQYISETAKYDSAVMTPEAGTYVPNEQTYIPLGGYEQNEYGFAQQTQVGQHPETQVAIRPDANAVITNTPSVEIDKEKTSLPSANTIMWLVWIAGVIAILFVNVISYLKLRNKAAACMKLQGNVYLSDEIDTPFCLGFFPAKIYLPSSLGEQERRYILMHEEYHIKRLDHVVKLFAFLALCIHWFNPLVWLAFVLAGKDMEMSCDEAVMRKMDTDIRAEYSASLLHLATGRRFAPSPLAFGEGNPKDRIKNIMNYKKPAFWLVMIAVMICVVVAVVLGTNPKSVSEEETIASGMTSEEPDASEESSNPTQQQEFREEYREQITASRRIAAYQELIALAETAIYDPESNGDNYTAYLDDEGNSLFSFEITQLYDGTGDIAYQNIGYLIQDINGDGVEELLFGENDPHLNGDWNGIVYDMFTYADGKLIHVFQGWNRRCYYLTEEGYIAARWNSSAFENGVSYYRFDGKQLILQEEIHSEMMGPADNQAPTITYTSAGATREISEDEERQINSKYHLAYPIFEKIGPVWTQVQDLNRDGAEDYIISNKSISNENGSIKYTTSIYLRQEGIVYVHEDLNSVLSYEVRNVDLDHDGEKEILLTVFPRVNDGGLEEYAVLKKDGNAWRKLEVSSCGDTELNNSFPLHITHAKKSSYDIQLSCDGIKKVIDFNVEYAYKEWVTMYEQGNSEAANAAYSIMYNYEHDIYEAKKGQPVGGIGAWGIWTIDVASFAGQPCLVAKQGIEGCYHNEIWGEALIYFDYDLNGKIRLLDLQYEPFSIQEVEEKPALSNEILDAYHAYADFFRTPEGIVGIDGTPAQKLVFSLEYIDEDEIPELVIGNTDGPHAACIYILTYHEGKMAVGSSAVGNYGSFNFFEKSGILYTNDFHMGASVYYLNQFEKNGAIEFLCEKINEYDNDLIALEETTCRIGKDIVTEEIFETFVAQQTKDKTAKVWSCYDNSKGYYRLTEDNLQRLENGELRIGMATATQINKKQLLYGSIGDLFGLGALSYELSIPTEQDYKLYFTSEADDRVFIFPDAREGNVAIGHFREVCLAETGDVNGDGKVDLLVIAAYEVEKHLRYDTRVYEQQGNSYVLDKQTTDELNAKYSDADEYPIWEIIEMPHD